MASRQAFGAALRKSKRPRPMGPQRRNAAPSKSTAEREFPPIVLRRRADQCFAAMRHASRSFAMCPWRSPAWQRSCPTFYWPDHHWLWPSLAAAGALSLLGAYDLVQRSHSLRRNYPIIGHLRWLFEFDPAADPPVPDRRRQRAVAVLAKQRSLVYRRAKDEGSERAFGTQLDVYARRLRVDRRTRRARRLARPRDFRVGSAATSARAPYSARSSTSRR